MSSESKKCANCNHDIFTKFDEISLKYYCIPHYPNVKQLIKERREI